jgi:molecular chaperone Hsp33
MPERKESDSDSWTCALKLSETVKREELLELPSEELLHRLFHEEDLRLFDAQPVVFACSCSKDNVVKMLRMLGKEEVNAVLDEKGLIEVHCEFCNQRYQFDAIDAKSLFSNIPTIEVSETRH